MRIGNLICGTKHARLWTKSKYLKILRKINCKFRDRRAEAELNEFSLRKDVPVDSFRQELSLCNYRANATFIYVHVSQIRSVTNNLKQMYRNNFQNKFAISLIIHQQSEDIYLVYPFNLKI
jgi:hypothetical protein